MSPHHTIIFILVCLASILMTRWCIQLSHSSGVFQHTDHRSLHSGDMPHIGGLGFAVVFYLTLFYLYSVENAISSQNTVVLMFGIPLCIAGLWDDLKGLGIKPRLIVQLVCVVAVTWILDIDLQLPLEHLWSAPQWLVQLIVAVSLVWWLNAFNFMDGIDGIAAFEAIFILLATYILGGFVVSSDANLVLDLHFYLSAAVLGFLFFNFPPAKTFMGDVGSTFLGYITGVFSLISINEGYLTPWIWLILSSVFLVDTTITLLRRFLEGKSVTEAHCEHAYQMMTQYLSRRYALDNELTDGQVRARAHRTVSLSVFAINLFWLFPLATWAALQPEQGNVLLVTAWLPLVFISIYTRKLAV